jgi:hypothetical protein
MALVKGRAKPGPDTDMPWEKNPKFYRVEENKNSSKSKTVGKA